LFFIVFNLSYYSVGIVVSLAKIVKIIHKTDAPNHNFCKKAANRDIFNLFLPPFVYNQSIT